MTIVLQDSCTASSDELLENHTPDIGAAWFKHPLQPDDFKVLAASGRVHQSSGSPSWALYYNDTAPATPDYNVSADLYVHSNNDNGLGICGRMSTTQSRWYIWRYFRGKWELLKFAPTSTLLGSFTQALTPGNTYNLELQMRDNGPNVDLVGYIDGVARVTYTDSASPITDVGRAGLRSNGFGTSSTSGYHLDNIMLDTADNGVVSRALLLNTESRGVVARGAVASAESNNTLSATAVLTTESTISVAVANSVSLESLRGLQSGYQAHVETLQALAITQVQRVESQASINRAQSAGIESLLSANRSISVDIELNKTIAQTIGVLLEFLSTSSFAATQRLTVENSQFTSVLSEHAIEANNTIEQLLAIDNECLSGILAISRQHWDQLQATQRPLQSNIETTGAAAIGALLVMAAEQRGHIAQPAPVAIEENQQVTNIMRPNAESLQLINAPLSIAFEQFAYVQTTLHGSIEAVAYVQLTTPFDLESLSVITATVDVNIEALRMIATAANVPLEALQGATANVIIDVIERTAYFTFDINKIVTIH